MKKTILVAIFLISKTAFCSIDTVKTDSKVTDVTVFFSGAQITRSADLKLKKGKYLLLIENLPHELNQQSIQVKGVDKCKILSVKHLIKQKNANVKGTEEQEMDKKIKAQELRIKEIKNKLAVFDLEEKLLSDNSYLGTRDGGTRISEIKEASDFYRIKLNEIKQSKLKLIIELDEIKENIQKLYMQINELTAKKRITYSLILIAVEAEKDINEDLVFSYYVESAGWEPLYDFRVEEITKPLTISYNANVFQSSGEDWNNVKIKLSTSNPSLSGTKPELGAFYLGRKNPSVTQVYTKGSGALRGTAFDTKTNERLPFANIVVYKYNTEELISSAVTDFDGNFMIKPIPAGTYDVRISFIGYASRQIRGVTIDSEKITFQDLALEPSATALKEVVIESYNMPLIAKDNTSSGEVIRQDINKMAGRSASSVAGVYSNSSDMDFYDFDNLSGGALNIRGGRGDATTTYIDGVKVRGSSAIPKGSVASVPVMTTNNISNSLKSTITFLEYVIDIPYSIPSDGEDYSIKIKDVSLSVDYEYYAVPKLENDAFLIAKIVDWTSLNLLSGKSSIYYQGTFTGESFIDVNTANDTFDISLGRDKNIIVKREINKQMVDKKIIGSSVKETIGLDITIRNNKQAPIKIIIEDQYPISEKKSIESELLESSSAKINEKTGKLTWELILTPNEKKTLNYKYAVKYPKLINLTIE